MKYHEKWSLTPQEMELISLLPYQVSYIVASADGVVNPEETSPYKVFINLMSNNADDSALVDICKISMDRHERGISEADLINSYLNENGLLDENGLYYKKVLVVDHFLRVLNLLDDFNKDKIKEFIFNLGLDTAYSYGVPENPMDDSEADELRDFFKWLDIDNNKYFEKKNRDRFYAYLNGE
tara:strand:- start:466 stop:1011 length:546 start_codon:yes stop_codon:yes gene_type:complete